MASTGEAWRLGRRPALDGIRGIAILLVLAGHTLIPGFRDGGKSGVALFFTLSGFLITSLLLEEHAATGSIDLRRFYVRRLRRLAPAQVATVVVVSSLGLALGARFLTVGDSAAALLYVKNLTYPTGLLGHFWSLAVEEQFYLVWAPVLAWLLARRLSRGVLLPLLVAGAVVSFAARVLLPTDWIGPLYIAEALPLMADPILAGCVLAVWLHGRPEGTTRPRVAAAGMLALLALAAVPFEQARVWGLGATAVIGVVLLAAAARGAGPSWLAHPVLRWFGARSYALYLWHWPIRFLLLDGLGIDSPLLLVPLVVAPACVLAELSWRYVEQPFRAQRKASPVGRELHVAHVADALGKG